MAITATFSADFTNFSVQVALAQTQLQSFETETQTVAASLSKMEQSISGTAIVQAATIAAEAVERLGGVSKLTYAELQQLGGQAQDAAEKLTALGQKVPVGIQELADAAAHAKEQMQQLNAASTANQQAAQAWGGALQTAAGYLGALGIDASISGLANFTLGVIESGSRINDMSEKLGLSVEAVQQFKYAAEQTGSSLDAVGGAISQMNKHLTEGDKSTVGALKAAGLSLQELRSLNPEEAFLAIADAIQKIPDPMEQSDVAMRLFGRGATELLPAIKEGFRDLANSAITMSDETVHALDRAGDAIARFKTGMTVAAGGFLAFMQDNFAVVDDTAKHYAELMDQIYKQAEKNAPKLKLPEQIVPPKLPADLLEINLLFKQQAEEIEKNARAQKKYQEEIEKSVAKIESGSKQSIESVLAFGLEERKTTESRMENMSKAADAIKKAEADLHDYQMKQTLDTTTYQVMKIWEKADKEVAALKGTADQNKYYADLIYQQAQQSQEAIYAAAAKNTKDLGDQILFDVVAMANKIKGVADEATDHITKASTALQTLQGGIKMPGYTSEYVGGQNYLVGPGGQRIQLGPHGELPDNFESVISGNAFPSAISNQPRIGTGFGSAIGGGIYQFNITQPLGTPQAIASAVGDALMNQLRGQGVRTP